MQSTVIVTKEWILHQNLTFSQNDLQLSPKVLPLSFYKTRQPKIEILQQNSENRQIACYKLQYSNFGLMNFQKLNSSCSREDERLFLKKFGQHFEFSCCLYQMWVTLSICHAFSFYEMRATF